MNDPHKWLKWDELISSQAQQLNDCHDQLHVEYDSIIKMVEKTFNEEIAMSFIQKSRWYVITFYVHL